MLTTAGELYSVGGVNTDGVAGNGTTTSSTTTKTKTANIQRNVFDDFIVVGYKNTTPDPDELNRTVYAITKNPFKKQFYAWGRNEQGQCGLPVNMNPILIPIAVPL
jgi:hypothetical protein